VLGPRAHICAFFSTPDEQTQALLPFIKDGLVCGEKVVHTVDPARRDEHLHRLASAGVDVVAAQESGQFELRAWTETHLRKGAFNQDETLAFFAGIVRDASRQGFPLTRFVTQMEWALQPSCRFEDLLEYEARANERWLRQDGPINPVICTYDLTKFGGEIVVDVMRTHPMTIIGGILHENPFFVPPEQFLRELRERQSVRRN